VSLEDKPVYDALSCTWSKSSEDSRISMAENDFPVTYHLFDALVKLSQGSKIPIWIDAICIEQANEAEKSIQVGQMTQIYENVRQVFIWLGDKRE
jgi:Heterokaryon incompatibility protein (HET)